MKLINSMLSLLFVLNGCMVTHHVTTELLTQHEILEQVNDRFADKRVTMTTADGRSYRGLFWGIGSDSLLYVDDFNQVQSLPTRGVYRIKSAPGSSGPIIMGVGGLVFGALMGSLIGASGYEPDPNGGLEQVVIAPMEGMAETASGAVVGGLIGLPVGVIIGSYIFAGHEVVLNKR